MARIRPAEVHCGHVVVLTVLHQLHNNTVDIWTWGWEEANKNSAADSYLNEDDRGFEGGQLCLLTLGVGLRTKVYLSV